MAKWQRARQLKSKYFPQIDGKLFWVECGPPQDAFVGRTLDATQDDPQVLVHNRLFTNILTPGGAQAAVDAAIVELLPEFADDVEQLTWEACVNG